MARQKVGACYTGLVGRRMPNKEIILPHGTWRQCAVSGVEMLMTLERRRQESKDEPTLLDVGNLFSRLPVE